MTPMWRALLLTTCLASCGGDDGNAGDAGLDAIARLAITVTGTSVVGTTSVKVTIVANGSTRTDTFPVGGLPATVDLPQPIQLSTWAITVDGINSGGTVVGRGTNSVPAGTSETTVNLSPI
jgi:hypothetical protein